MSAISVKKDDRICIFKVTANGSSMSGELDPKPWRTIAIPESATLYRLAEAINEAFDFLFDHPFGFYDNFLNPYKSERGFELFADIGEESDFPGVKRTKINEAFPSAGINFLFFFDYGDEWFFPVELIEYRYPQAGKKYPAILEKIGESPEQYPSMEDDEEEMIVVTLKARERDLLLERFFTDCGLEERLKAARIRNGEITVGITENELRDLILESPFDDLQKGREPDKEVDELYAKIQRILDENGIDLVEEDEDDSEDIQE